MGRISLILILIFFQSVLVINEGADYQGGELTKNSKFFAKLLPELMSAGSSLEDVIGQLKQSSNDLNGGGFSGDAGGGTPKRPPLEYLSNLLPLLSSSSSSLGSLASLASLTSSISPFSQSSVWSSLLSISDKLKARALSEMQNSLITDQDAYRSTQELIISRGFSYDDHYVTTKDGTILRLFRIINPYAQAVLGLDNLHPVLLQHGLFLSSDCWLINSPGETVAPWVNRHKPLVTGNNLATFLSNQGYDVWIGNNRGNRYSTNHTKLDYENSNAFWNFSLDEYVKEDTPAMIDHIIKVTNKDKVTVVAYSTGSTQFFGLLSFAPEYADRIDLLLTLGPIGYLGHIAGACGNLLKNQVVHEIIQQFEGKFPPIDDIPIDEMVLLLCNHQITRVLCATAFDYIAGINAKQLNQSRLFVYLNHFDHVSAKLVDQLFQIRKSNIFHLYDYGESENLIKYGHKEPPKYPYSNIILDKIILISGLNDAISTPEDVHQLRKKLSGKILIDHIIKNPKWNHWDFIFGKSAYENVNKFIAETIEKYAGKNLDNPQINQI